MLKDYKKNGFFKIKSFLDKSDKKVLLNASYLTFKKFISIRKFSSFENQNLHNKLIFFRRTNPKKFGVMYDMLNLNASIRSIFFQKKFQKIFSKLLNVPKEQIFLNGFMFRLDAPNDKRNILGWHQDSAYYEMTYPKYNAGVCWISLTNNSVKNGILQFVTASHKKGYIKTKLTKKSKLSSEQFQIRLNKNEKSSYLISKFGDASFFHMNIKHKSGFNSSERIRFTLGCRFHDMSKGFNTGKELYIYNKSSRSQLY